MSYLLDGYNWDPADPTSITNLLLAHLSVSGISLFISLLIAIPIAVLIARSSRLYVIVVSTAGVLYTIPSLAFFAFLVPFTGLSAATVIIPLVVYNQLVLIRNTVAAIRSVDPALIEVGRAMGMNPLQVQVRVVWPLALPVMIAGFRVATVTTIGIATLAHLVGTDTLGTLIFQGINFARTDLIAAGTILVSALAIGADLALLGLQALLSRGRSKFAMA